MSDSELPERPYAGPLLCLAPDLKLSLACPECGAAAEMPWERLASGMRCRSCKCCFRIGRDGHLQSQRNATRIQFTCPRCGLVGTLRSRPDERGTECAGCDLPLFAGPNGEICGPREMAEIKRQARRAAAKPRLAAGRASRLTGARWPRHARAAAIAACALLLAIVLARWYLADDSACPAARKLTLRCLGDVWEQTLEEIPDDDYQRMEFRRWRIMYFASIRDAHRPAGDRVRVDVAVVTTDAQQQTLRVTVTSSFLGQRSHVQCWQRQEAGWRFDAAASLRESAGGGGVNNRPGGRLTFFPRPRVVS